MSWARSHRALTGGIAVAVLVIGVLVWRAVDPGSSSTPFPLVGVSDVGDPVEHTVQRLSIRGDGTAQSEEPTTWEGSLVVDPDPFDPNDDEAPGRGLVRPMITETGIEVGLDVRTFEWSVFLVDPDNDDIVDLMVLRAPGQPDDGIELSPFSDLAFVVSGSEEIVVARTRIGQQLAGAYVQSGLLDAVCNTFGASTELPTEDPDATSVFATPDDDYVLWCQPPLLQPTRVDGGLAAGELQAGTGDEGAPPGIRQYPVVGAQADLTEELCDALEDDVDDVEDNLVDHAEEIADRLQELKSDYEDAKSLLDAVDDLVTGSRQEKIDALESLLGEDFGTWAENELYNQMTTGNEHLDDFVKALQDGASSGFGPDFYKSIQEWAAGVAEDVADVLNGLIDEECGPEWCRMIPGNGPKDCRERPEGDDGGDGDTVRSYGKGEPHITTWDGLGYDFQGVGEWTLAHGQDIDVQARYSNLRDGSVSVAVAAAVQLPGTEEPISTYVEDAASDRWTVYLGDVPYVVSPGQSALGDYLVTLEWPVLRVQTDGSVGVDVHFMETNRPLFNIVGIDVEPGLVGTIEGGLYGTPNGDRSDDFRLPDGSTIPQQDMDFETLYGEFGEAWRVTTVEQSLFTYAPGTDPSTFFNPRFPNGEVTLKTLTEARLRRGVIPCLEAGVWIEPSLSECAFDVAIADDDLWVQTGVQSQQVLATPSSPVALPGGLLDQTGQTVLWTHDGFEVRALIAGDSNTGTLVIRALEVETAGDTELIYPGWREVPSSVDLPGARHLVVSPFGASGMVVQLTGSPEGVTGLSTEQGETVGAPDEADPFVGGPRLTAEQLDRWRSEWLTDGS